MTGTKETSALALPPELEAWQQQNANVIGHIHSALREAEAPLTEEQLWNLLARTFSPAWADARANLTDAEQKIAIHKSHENRALGAIGLALESDSINKELAQYDEALSVFTILDEQLHQDDDLKKVLDVLVKDQRMLEESIRISRGIADLDAVFAQVAISPKAQKPLGSASLSKAFGMAKRLLGKSSGPAKTATQGQSR